MEHIDTIFCIINSNNDNFNKKDFIETNFKKDNFKYDFIELHDDFILNSLLYSVKNDFLTKLPKHSIINFIYHIECIKKIASASHDKLYGIIEDDVKVVNDFKTKLNNYFNNSFHIVESIIYEPLILFLSGIKHKRIGFNIEQDNNKFINLFYHHSTNFYLINKKMANLILNNYLPIVDPYNIFIGELIKMNNIETFYYANPILSYSLSSLLYSSFFTHNDKKILNKFKKNTTREILDVSTCQINILDSTLKIQNFINEAIFNNLNNNPFKFLLCHSDFNSFNISFGSDLHHINSHSFVYGGGVRYDYHDIQKPLKIYFIRGPLSRQFLKTKNIQAPDIYGDFTLLLPLFYSPVIQQKYLIGLVIDIHSAKQIKNLTRDIKNKKKIFIINIDFNPLLLSINHILASNIIITTSVYGAMIAHAYNKKVIILNSKNFSINIYDYFQSIGISNIPTFDYNDSLIDNIDDIVNTIPYPQKYVIKKLQNNVIDNTHFIDLKNNIKKIDYISENKTSPL